MAVQPRRIGTPVTLKALVTKTRESTHIGDLFHGVYPSTPDVGDVITLGVGTLRLGVNSDRRFTVGVQPPDGRAMWLNIKALYRCHEQTVELFYEPQDTRGGIDSGTTAK